MNYFFELHLLVRVLLVWVAVSAVVSPVVGRFLAEGLGSSEAEVEP